MDEIATDSIDVGTLLPPICSATLDHGARPNSKTIAAKKQRPSFDLRRGYPGSALGGIHRLLQAIFRLNAHKPIHHFSPLENHQGRNRADAVAGGGTWAFVDVDLADLDRTRVLGGQLLDHRGD